MESDRYCNKNNFSSRGERALGVMNTVGAELHIALRLQGSGYVNDQFVTFDRYETLYERRREIQSHAILLGRNTYSQAKFDDFTYSVASAGFNLNQVQLEHIIGTVPFFVRHNDFPYNVPTDTEHLVAWYGKNVNPSLLKLYLTAYFLNNNIRKDDFIIVKNPPSLRSVQSIEHLHLFTRKIETQRKNSGIIFSHDKSSS